MSESTNNKKNVPEKITGEIIQISRHIHGVSDILDYSWEKIIPSLAKERTDEFFTNGQKIIKYIFRYLI